MKLSALNQKESFAIVRITVATEKPGVEDIAGYSIQTWRRAKDPSPLEQMPINAHFDWGPAMPFQ
ncbi:hypothetical protein [Phyllobacterium zundukense]|uniref:Uncharacterized protein n=1 Tax=Phyllobacterium zundukense TaxID=1867719 RepID=A0ACD4CXE6_9HYPH|nr:hypothetical protein [Phyllobacterium zundukense]UXN58214.1 hypothetical protein N8E88_05185 [Phyllobacterium zundukense]